MAVTVTNLTTSGSSSNATSYATASISPTNGRVYLVGVTSIRSGGGSPTTPTVSGASMTWTQVNTVVDAAPATRTTLFRGLATAASSGALTVDFGAQTQESACWSVVELLNVDTSGTNGANAIVQSVTNSTNGGTSLTVTLAAFGSVNNATFGVIGANVTEAITNGSGFTELGESFPQAVIQSQYKQTNDTSVDWSWTTGASAAAIAAELKEYVPVNNIMAWG